MKTATFFKTLVFFTLNSFGLDLFTIKLKKCYRNQA